MHDPVSSHPSWHVVYYISNFRHFDRCIVLSHCGFNLHVPDA